MRKINKKQLKEDKGQSTLFGHLDDQDEKKELLWSHISHENHNVHC